MGDGPAHRYRRSQTLSLAARVPRISYNWANPALPYEAVLHGKWLWIWNWRRCLDGDPLAVARRLKDADCVGVFLKAGDGGHDFAQGAPIAEVR